MRSLITALIAGLLVSAGLVAEETAGCDRPWPVEIPEDADTRDEVLAVQRQVKQYLKDAEAYLACNDAAQKALSPDSAATPQTLQILISQYNNTVDEMHVTGEQFNALVRKYKSKQDG